MSTNDVIRKRSVNIQLARTQCPDIANLSISPCAIVMVGLPARGKTYMAKKLSRYLNWIGLDTKVFNVGEYRRIAAADFFTSSADFFRPDNEEALRIRERSAKDALVDLCTWLKHGGEVAVYDATNTNRARRQMIHDYVTKENGFKIFFIESICSDHEIIEANIKEVKLFSPDYVMTDDKEAAMDDFKRRINNYEAQYESLDDDFDKQESFMKIFNQGQKYLVNKVQSHVQSRVVYYLMNIHVLPHTIYITRHGESELNFEGRIGGDSDLSARGKQYASAMANFVNALDIKDLHVWTSLMKRTIQTAVGIHAPKEHWKALNELDAGVCEEMTYKEIEDKFPEDFRARDSDKYHYRYPGGESYQDLVTRLEPVILELERQENVLVICHQAVARCLLSYFLNTDQDELPYIKVPLHTIIKLTPVAYGCQVEHIPFDIDAVDTYRPCPVIKRALTSEERRARRKMTSECLNPVCCSRTTTTHAKHSHSSNSLSIPM